MVSNVCLHRLKKEYKLLKKRANPQHRDGTQSKKYTRVALCHTRSTRHAIHRGCISRGLQFPTEYPHKPSAIMMFTPNGRFKTHT